MDRRAMTDEFGGASRRVFKNFRELAEYMKGLAYEEVTREAGVKPLSPE